MQYVKIFIKFKVATSPGRNYEVKCVMAA